jgi:hypothetical protein
MFPAPPRVARECLLSKDCLSPVLRKITNNRDVWRRKGREHGDFLVAVIIF